MRSLAMRWLGQRGALELAALGVLGLVAAGCGGGPYYARSSMGLGYRYGRPNVDAQIVEALPATETPSVQVLESPASGQLQILGAQPGQVQVIETQSPTVYIVLQPQQDVAVVEPQVVDQAARGWVPDGLPRPNPFARSRTWVGDYDCVQGNTGLALRILDVRGRVVRAIFDFQHAPSGATGEYLVAGTYDPETRRVHFDPGSWISRPEDYVMVSMTGEIASDGSLFAGRIDHPGCGAFKLKPTR